VLKALVKCFVTDRLQSTPAYRDGVRWYIPVKEGYPHGGSEVSVAFCEPEIDDVMTEGMRRVLPG
jgi:hypothetical protein